jgi:hypothetical protein
VHYTRSDTIGEAFVKLWRHMRVMAVKPPKPVAGEGAGKDAGKSASDGVPRPAGKPKTV